MRTLKRTQTFLGCFLLLLRVATLSLLKQHKRIYNIMLGALPRNSNNSEVGWQCGRLSGETCWGRHRHSPWLILPVGNLKNDFLFSLCCRCRCFLRWLQVWSMVNCERGRHSTPRPPFSSSSSRQSVMWRMPLGGERKRDKEREKAQSWNASKREVGLTLAMLLL